MKFVLYYGYHFTEDNKMSKILKDLYNGRIFPGDTYSSNEREIRRKLGEAERLRKELWEALSDDKRSVLKAYENTVTEANVLVCEASFVDGYRLGARMMAEVYSGEE